MDRHDFVDVLDAIITFVYRVALSGKALEAFRVNEVVIVRWNFESDLDHEAWTP